MTHTPTRESEPQNLSVKNLGGVWVLHTPHGPVTCVYRNPFPMPHQITGRVEFQVPACSSNCPFFNLNRLVDTVGNEPDLHEVYFDCVGCSKIVKREGGI